MTAESRFDEIRAAAIGQFTLLAGMVDGLEDALLTTPTRLPGWRVSELVAHLARNWEAVTSGLRKPSPDHAEVELTDYYDGAAGVAAAVQQRAQDDLAAITLGGVRRHLRDVVETGVRLLQAVERDRLMLARLGSLALSDFLVTRCVEGVVHGLDLARALDRPPAGLLHAPAAHLCVQLLLDRAEAATGRSVAQLQPSGGDDVVAVIEHLAGRGPRHGSALSDFPAVLR
jgi:uncharacterized protein (TIGR03083 family)